MLCWAFGRIQKQGGLRVEGPTSGTKPVDAPVPPFVTSQKAGWSKLLDLGHLRGVWQQVRDPKLLSKHWWKEFCASEGLQNQKLPSHPRMLCSDTLQTLQIDGFLSMSKCLKFRDDAGWKSYFVQREGQTGQGSLPSRSHDGGRGK